MSSAAPPIWKGVRDLLRAAPAIQALMGSGPRFYWEMAPEDTGFPYVVGAVKITGEQPALAHGSLMLDVWAEGPNGAAAAAGISGAIEDLLDGAHPPVASSEAGAVRTWFLSSEPVGTGSPFVWRHQNIYELRGFRTRTAGSILARGG